MKGKFVAEVRERRFRLKEQHFVNLSGAAGPSF